MRQITSSHAMDMTKLLQHLVSKDALIQDGQGRWTRYALPPVLTPYICGQTPYIWELTPYITRKLLIMSWMSYTKIAEPARQSRRLSSKQLESIVLKLCEKHWLLTRHAGRFTFRRPGRSDLRVWPRACPWPYKPRQPQAAHYPSGFPPSKLRSLTQ